MFVSSKQQSFFANNNTMMDLTNSAVTPQELDAWLQSTWVGDGGGGGSGGCDNDAMGATAAGVQQPQRRQHQQQRQPTAAATAPSPGPEIEIESTPQRRDGAGRARAMGRGGVPIRRRSSLDDASTPSFFGIDVRTALQADGEQPSRAGGVTAVAATIVRNVSEADAVSDLDNNSPMLENLRRERVVDREAAVSRMKMMLSSSSSSRAASLFAMDCGTGSVGGGNNHHQLRNNGPSLPHPPPQARSRRCSDDTTCSGKTSALSGTVPVRNNYQRSESQDLTMRVGVAAADDDAAPSPPSFLGDRVPPPGQEPLCRSLSLPFDARGALRRGDNSDARPLKHSHSLPVTPMSLDQQRGGGGAGGGLRKRSLQDPSQFLMAMETSRRSQGHTGHSRRSIELMRETERTRGAILVALRGSSSHCAADALLREDERGGGRQLAPFPSSPYGHHHSRNKIGRASSGSSPDGGNSGVVSWRQLEMRQSMQQGMITNHHPLGEEQGDDSMIKLDRHLSNHWRPAPRQHHHRQRKFRYPDAKREQFQHPGSSGGNRSGGDGELDQESAVRAELHRIAQSIC